LNYAALLAALLTGVFSFLGMIAINLVRDNTKPIRFSLGCSASIMTLLVCFEIVPEAYSAARVYMQDVGALFHVGLFFASGIVMLKILDLFIPDHGHRDEVSENKFTHIGVMSCIALMIHNLIEGAALYVTYRSSPAAGTLFALGVGLHNLPIGMMASAALTGTSTGRLKNWALLFGLVISSFLGGLTVHLFNIDLEHTTAASALLSVSAGMLFYIVVFELADEIREHIREKETYLGILLGVIILAGALAIMR
jgi:ZIP family zinc transporter